MPRLTDFTKGDTLPPISWFTDMEAKTHFRGCSASGEGSDFTPELGGIHRFGVIAKITREASGEDQYIIDNEIDWRDRIIFATCAYQTTAAATNPVFPGVETDAFASTKTAVGYTGTGGATYDTPLESGSLELRVDPSTGALQLNVIAYGSWVRCTILLTVIATAQTGERSTPDTMPAIPYGGNGDAIEPIELNALQDGAMLTQLRDADGADPDVDTLIDEKVFPLGPAMSGDPAVPQKYTALSRKTYSSNGGLLHRSHGVEPYRAREVRRQRVAGSPRMFFGRSVGGSTNMAIDTTFDWRDRMIFAIGRSDTSNDIIPGDTDDDQHNSATSFKKAFYSGPGAAGESGSYDVELNADAYLYVHEDTGYLCIDNIAVLTNRLTMMVYASFPLGPRTPRS